ncbi:MAG: hypothetical protein PHS97_05505 [Oscillospiraceae bacterium]|nr:hypothetical protein [Oscillospiraceae bacterium]
MPNNMPYDKWFWSDWFASTAILSIEAKGIWHELLGRMYLDDRTYFVEGTAEELSRMVGCSEHQFETSISEINRRNVADVTFGYNNVTGLFRIECRRYKKAYLERKRASIGMAKTRADRKCYSAVTSPSDLNHNPEPESDININNTLSLFDGNENDVKEKTTVFSFEDFWTAYGKKVEKVKCERIYEKIPESDRAVIRERVSPYVASTPDLKFRKNPQTWLNGKCWNDEIISQEEKRNDTAGSYGRYVPKN